MEKEEFKNDLVHVVVHRKPHCVVEYEVDAARSICVEAQKKAARSIGKEVVVPGFRKGKAPVEIVAKRYPHDLDKRWQEGIANAAFREAANLAQVPLVRNDATISFKMHSHSKDGAKVTLSFETVPSVPAVDPAKCVLNAVKRPEVNEEKVDETIRQTQMFFSKWVPVEGRAVEEGDFLILDVEVLDQDPPQMLFSNTRFEVADKSMAQWMKDLVIGKNVGEKAEGTSVPDPELSEEEKKEFPPKKVRVTIKAIEKVELPELNDDFAKNLGVATVGELKEKIEALLNKKADEHVREQQREQVTEFLMSQSFEIPHSVLEKETQFRLQQMIQDPNFKKQWDESDETKRGELIDNTKKNAEKAVKIFYLCRKIAADQNMSITPKDVPLANTDPLESLLYPSAERHDPRQPDVKQAEAYSKILLEKTEDWVIAHARIAPAGEKKPAAEKKEKSEAASPKKKATKKAAAPKKKATPEKAAAKKASPKKPAAKKAAKKATAPKKKATPKSKKEK